MHWVYSEVILGALAEQMSVTTAELKDMISKGQVSLRMWSRR